MSILFLLLRFLTVPVSSTPLPTTAAVTDGGALPDARAQMAAIEAGPSKVRVFMRGAHDPMRLSCVAQRLAEAQVHATLARDEMKVLADPPPGAPAERNQTRADDRAHALRRLALIAQRTQEVERAARACIDDELSTVNATKYETEVPAAVRARGDVTNPPPAPYPCPVTDCTVIPAP